MGTFDYQLTVQLKIFDSLVAPILLHGCEILGIGKYDNIEKVHLQFLKRIINASATTPNFLMLSELGRYPLDLIIEIRMLCFWSRLISTEKLSSRIYRLLFTLYNEGNFKL